MKLLVPTKRIPNPDQPIRVRPDATGIDDSETGFVINPFDAIALEKRFAYASDKQFRPVKSLLSQLEGAECTNELRTALAMGRPRDSHCMR